MKNLLFLVFILSSLATQSQTISDFRGPGRTGIYPDKNLLREWPENGPEQLWSAGDLGKGYTSPAMGKEYIYVTGRFDDHDYLTALDYSGKFVWKVKYGRSWNKSYTDSRCVPVINGDKVYLLSGMGELACHDAKTGKQLWFRNAYEEFKGICNPHGVSESLLVLDDKVFYTPGGFETSMVAFNKNNGELIWKTESLRDSSAYVSPLYIVHNGQEMVISLLANILFAVDPSNGKILWDYNYIDIQPPEENPKLKWTNCNTPLYHNGELFFTKGYDHPAAMFVINDDGKGVKLKWTNDLMDTHHCNNVLIDGYIYGSTWIHNAAGNWACIDWETGKDQWEAEMNNKGSIIAADGMMYCYDEKKGQLALVRPNPEKFDIVSSFFIKEGTGPHWAHPVIHNGILCIRHGEILMAFEIRN